MKKFKIVFFKGPSVTVEGESIEMNPLNHVLELRDSEGKQIAGFYQFQYWLLVDESL